MAEKTKEAVGSMKHANIHAALSAFQGELKPMERSGRVQYQTRGGDTVDFTYTPLSEIMKEIYPLLAKHGLAVRHEVVKDGQVNAVEAVLTHETYSEERGVLKDPEAGTNGVREYGIYATNELRSGPVKIAYGSDMKDTGSAITYARRYSLTMLLGISSEEDKDAAIIEQTAENAQSFVYKRAKKGIDDAKTPADVDKAVDVLKKDLALIEKGKAASLGLTKEKIDELIAYAAKRSDALVAGAVGSGIGKKE